MLPADPSRPYERIDVGLALQARIEVGGTMVQLLLDSGNGAQPVGDILGGGIKRKEYDDAAFADSISQVLPADAPRKSTLTLPGYIE